MDHDGTDSGGVSIEVNGWNLPFWLVTLVYENWIVGFIFLAYWVFGTFLNVVFYGEGIIKIRFWFHWFNGYLVYFLFSFFVIYALAAAFRIRKPINVFHYIVKDFSTNYLVADRVLGAILVYLLVSPFFCVFSGIKSHICVFNSYYADEMLMKIDYFVHFGNHPWKLLHSVFDVAVLTKFLDLIYSIWFYLLFTMCLWMSISRCRRLRLHFFICFFMTWIVLGNIFAILMASGGPCYYDKFVIGWNPYIELMEYLKSSGYSQNVPLLALRNQKMLWESFATGIPLEYGGGISAMPSLHVAMAFLFFLVGLKINKIVGFAFLCFALLILVGSVHLGWHYAVDGYVAIVAVFAIWRISDKILNRWGYQDV